MGISSRTREDEWWEAPLAVVVTGLVLGGVNSLSNALGSPYSPYALRPYEGVFTLEVLAAVIGTAWAWSLVAFALGWLAPKAWLAPVTAVLALILATVVYYLSDHAFGLNDNLETGEITYWALLSIGAGSVFGLLGNLARRPQWWSLLPRLMAPAAIVLFSYSAGSDQIQPWPQVIAWVVAAALTVALSLQWLLMRRRPRNAVS